MGHWELGLGLAPKQLAVKESATRHALDVGHWELGLGLAPKQLAVEESATRHALDVGHWELGLGLAPKQLAVEESATRHALDVGHWSLFAPSTNYPPNHFALSDMQHLEMKGMTNFLGPHESHPLQNIRAPSPPSSPSSLSACFVCGGGGGQIFFWDSGGPF